MSTVLEKQQARLIWLQHSCMMTSPNDYSLQSDSMPHFHGFFDNGDNVHSERQPETFLGSSDFSIGGSELFANDKMGFVRTDVAAHSTEIYYCLSRTSSCQVGMELGEAARMEEDVALMEETQSDNQRDSSNKRKAEYFAAEEFKGQVEVQSKVKEKTSTEISADSCKKNHKTSEVRKPDYIHVRARRGQATDSHSLAERARREKISKKMKCLQELVPGCKKITGRAGLLDEIINYIQSLQRQIEFLSMKLAAFAPRQELNADNFSGKEYVASFPTATISPGVINMSQPEHNLVQEEAEAKNPTQAAPERTASSSGFIHELCLDSSCFSQVQPFWKPDSQDLHNMGFHKGWINCLSSPAFYSYPCH